MSASLEHDGRPAGGAAPRAAAAATVAALACAVLQLSLVDALFPAGPLAVAAGGAAAFGERATRRSGELNATIAGALPGQSPTAQVLECRDRLATVGYVWKPPDAEDVWQPGIPSLMTYVAAHAS